MNLKSLDSLTQSDKTLLKCLLEHKNCNKVKFNSFCDNYFKNCRCKYNSLF